MRLRVRSTLRDAGSFLCDTGWVENELRYQKITQQIAAFSTELDAAIANIPQHHFTAVRDDGEWSIAQIVHHLVDAHINKSFQIKQILTEERPYLMEYLDESFPHLPGGNSADMDTSLRLLGGVHERMTILLQEVHKDDWLQVGIHPVLREVTVFDIAKSIVTHGSEHLKQIQEIINDG